MATRRRKPLQHYLSLNYPFVAHMAGDGEYYVEFPDLPGLMTGAATLEELPAMLREALSFWIESEYADGAEIPEPTIWQPEEYSGKFNVRLPRSLHRTLAQTAADEGVSLNQYGLSLLARGDTGKQALRDGNARQAAPARHIADERGTYDASRVGPRGTRSRKARGADRP